MFLSSDMSYQKIHQLLTQYWSEASKRNVEYTCLEVFFTTTVLFQGLRTVWEKNEWDIDELKVVCMALDCLCAEIDPNKFIGKETEYIERLKTFYQENKR